MKTDKIFIKSFITVLMITLFSNSNIIFAQDTSQDKSKTNQQNENSTISQAQAVLPHLFPIPDNNKPRFAYPLRDLEIAADVALAIYTDRILGKYDIDVKVKNSKVYLAGIVDFDGASEYAEQIASKVTGVLDVQNNLTYYQDNTDTFESDLVILEDLYDRLETNPILEIEDVDIAVYNGVVRLSGVVNSYLEKDLIAQEALKTKARRVFNFILVGEGPDTYEIKNSGDRFIHNY